MQVAHPGPDGDLGAGAYAGVLLQIRGSGDLEIYSEQVGVEGRAARDGGLHVLVSAQTGTQDSPPDRCSWQRSEDAETAVGIDCESSEFAESLGGQ